MKSIHKTLGAFDDRAVLIMDGYKSHKIQLSLDEFAPMRVEVRFLVAHTSHITQPLDLGIFWQAKTFMRSRFQYLINLQDLDDAIAKQIDRENLDQPPSPERGMMIIDLIIQILTAFHQARPQNGVSVFKRLVFSRALLDQTPTWSIARRLLTEPGCGSSSRDLGFSEMSKKIEQAYQQLKIANMNNALQRASFADGAPASSTIVSVAPQHARSAQFISHPPSKRALHRGDRRSERGVCPTSTTQSAAQIVAAHRAQSAHFGTPSTPPHVHVTAATAPQREQFVPRRPH